MEKYPSDFTSIELQSLNQRIQELEISVMDLRIPWYIKYKIHLRVICCISMIPILIGIGFAFSIRDK